MLMIFLLKHNHQHMIAITNMSKQTQSYGSQSNCNVLSQGSRAQLKETLTSIMIIQTKLKLKHLKSIWLVMSEAGDAVCGDD